MLSMGTPTIPSLQHLQELKALSARHTHFFNKSERRDGQKRSNKEVTFADTLVTKHALLPAWTSDEKTTLFYSQNDYTRFAWHELLKLPYLTS